VRHRAWGWLLLIPATMAVLVAVLAPFPSFHQHLSLAGTTDRFASTVVRAGRSDARAALWLDNLFVLSWVLVVPRLLRAGSERWAPERRSMSTRWLVAPRIALAAGAADLVQNALALTMVGRRQPATGLTLALTGVTWICWLLFIWSLAAVCVLVIGPLLAPVVRPLLRGALGRFDRLAGAHPPLLVQGSDAVGREHGGDAAGGEADADGDGPDGDEPDGDEPDGDGREDGAPRLGISVSGGGIRAASVALGALRRLDGLRDDGPSLFLRSSWLVAVSGGAYTAGGWRITRRPASGVAPVAGADRDGAFDADHPWAITVRERRRFLDNGSMSFVGGVANLVLRSVVVLGALASVLYLIGRAAGRAVRTRSMHQFFPFTDSSNETLLGWRDLVPARLVLPGALLLLAAGVLAFTAYSSPRPATRRRLRGPALVTLVTGVGLLLVLVGVPAGIVYGRELLTALPLGDSAEASAGALGLLSSLGIVAAVTGVVVAQFKRRWMTMGGVLLAVAALLFAGKVADTFAYGYDGVWDRTGYVIGAVLWIVLLDMVAAHRLTLGGVYRKRLASTFACADGESAPLDPLPYSDEPHWATYAGAAGPELVVAATAHATRPTFCGVPAYGFTFRPTGMTMYDRTDGSSAHVPAHLYPRGSWWDGYPRGWIVSRSMALSGAALASAMGRQALGTTQSLLVALNLRLGCWVPNPRFVHWFGDPASSPRVHLGYLLKELFNRYHPDRDAFVYVADGGHRENLGLVELLRERPDVVFCIDASGDAPQSFQTLREAIELARVELGIDIDIDLTCVRSQVEASMPLDCAVEGLIRYPAPAGGGAASTGRLLYGRSQLSEASHPELLQHGAADARFPDYSTLDQYLTETEHLQLVAMGDHVAERMVRLFDTGNSIQHCV
jgi:hypothetical protein